MILLLIVSVALIVFNGYLMYNVWTKPSEEFSIQEEIAYLKQLPQTKGVKLQIQKLQQKL